jgi:glycosyltransferase involved in cell wall biosynthesis
MLYCPVRQLLLVCNALYFSKMYQEGPLARHSLGFRVEFKLRRWLICQSVRHSDVVMTPTQAVLDDLRQFVEVKSQSAMVNPYGAAPVDIPLLHPKKMTPELPGAAQRVVCLIYVSYYAEHKNLCTLLRTMPLLNCNGARRFVLKTTADPAWKGSDWTVTWREDLALARRPDVELLGLLFDGDLQQLYREADIFVFPSYCESFGHPMAQAMGHGLPIVAADTPVNREICGDAAMYFSPLDPQDLAEKVRLLWNDVTARNRLYEAGQRRAARRFRWETHVAQLLEAARVPTS